VVDRRAIACNYLAFRFWWDVLTTLPWDAIVLAGLGLVGSEGAKARYIALLGLLKLVGGRGGVLAGVAQQQGAQRLSSAPPPPPLNPDPHPHPHPHSILTPTPTPTPHPHPPKTTQGRMYRVGRLFSHLEYSLALPLAATMLIRNAVYVVFVAHWAGCSVFFIARQEDAAHEAGDPGAPPYSWAGRAAVAGNLHVDLATLRAGGWGPETTW
jgi:hypothetical protein